MGGRRRAAAGKERTPPSQTTHSLINSSQPQSQHDIKHNAQRLPQGARGARAVDPPAARAGRRRAALLGRRRRDWRRQRQQHGRRRRRRRVLAVSAIIFASAVSLFCFAACALFLALFPLSFFALSSASCSVPNADVHLSLNSQQQQQSARHRSADARSQRIAEALLQPPRAPAPLEEQVVALLAVQQGHADAVAPEDAAAWVARAVRWAREVAPRALREVAETRQLTAAAEKGITDALQALAAAAAAGGSGGSGGGGGSKAA